VSNLLNMHPKFFLVTSKLNQGVCIEDNNND